MNIFPRKERGLTTVPTAEDENNQLSSPSRLLLREAEIDTDIDRRLDGIGEDHLSESDLVQ